MNILVTAKDSTGALLYVETVRVADWRAACRFGMTCRNELAGDGIRVDWVKA